MENFRILQIVPEKGGREEGGEVNISFSISFRSIDYFSRYGFAIDCVFLFRYKKKLGAPPPTHRVRNDDGNVILSNFIEWVKMGRKRTDGLLRRTRRFFYAVFRPPPTPKGVVNLFIF